MANSNSNCWHAPLFITVSGVLAFIAITTAIHSPPPADSAAATSTAVTIRRLSHNASKALRNSGFNIMATLLSLSPEIFLASPHSTIFAVKDSGLANSSLSPWFLKHLLQYHTSPLFLSMDDLLNKHQGSCIPTTIRGKNLALSMVDSQDKSIEINGVLISDPDMFLQENVAIHGVLGPFSNTQTWDSVQSPDFDSNSGKNMVEWRRIVRFLSSNGFVSFAIGLNSVIGGILGDYGNLSSVTVFGPPELEFVASSSPMLEKIVRLHLLPRKYSYGELASLPDKAKLETLLPSQKLEIRRGFNVTLGFAIGGVPIVAPEIFSSEMFVFHGISRAFEVADRPSI